MQKHETDINAQTRTLVIFNDFDDLETIIGVGAGHINDAKYATDNHR